MTRLLFGYTEHTGHTEASPCIMEKLPMNNVNVTIGRPPHDSRGRFSRLCSLKDLDTDYILLKTLFCIKHVHKLV